MMRGQVGLPDEIGHAIAALPTPADNGVNASRIEMPGNMFV